MYLYPTALHRHRTPYIVGNEFQDFSCTSAFCEEKTNNRWHESHNYQTRKISVVPCLWTCTYWQMLSFELGFFLYKWVVVWYSICPSLVATVLPGYEKKTVAMTFDTSLVCEEIRKSIEFQSYTLGWWRVNLQINYYLQNPVEILKQLWKLLIFRWSELICMRQLIMSLALKMSLHDSDRKYQYNEVSISFVTFHYVKTLKK